MFVPSPFPIASQPLTKSRASSVLTCLSRRPAWRRDGAAVRRPHGDDDGGVHLTFVLVLVWTAWSIRCYDGASEPPPLRTCLPLLPWLCYWMVRDRADDAEPEPDVSARFALRTLLALALDYAAFVIHFLAFSMLAAAGRLDMMMFAVIAADRDALADDLPLIGPLLAVVNFNAAAAALTLAPAFVWPTTLGGDPSAIGGGAGDAESSMDRHVERRRGGGGRLSLWMGAVSRGGFALLLAVASAAAGIDVSCKIRNIAAFDPNLQSYAHQKASRCSSRRSPSRAAASRCRT